MLIGALIGALMPFLFSALTMQAVGRAAMAMVNEVRRQFREIPGIMEGTGKPEYARAVAIATDGALKEMIVPGVLAMVVAGLRSARSSAPRPSAACWSARSSRARSWP